jgi:hypothetical protein
LISEKKKCFAFNKTRKSDGASFNLLAEKINAGEITGLELKFGD